jgi:PHD/YefM family antitoxin component YafN of YafNO toxin-antitoxin module
MTRHSRRALLAMAGLVAGGQVVRAAQEQPRGSLANAEARLKLAVEAIDAVRLVIGRGRFTAGERDPIVIWSRRRYEARLDISKSKAERVTAAQEHVDEMRKVEEVVARLTAAGELDRLSLMDAQYRRLEAENWLEQQKAK